MQAPDALPSGNSAAAAGIPRDAARHEGRQFLFLQGPHGPFFDRLAGILRASGAGTWRVGFNRGDEIFWRFAPGYIAFTGAPDAWADTCSGILTEKNITDIVLYGDTRPHHAVAITRARAVGIRVHVFEEGYLRPWWVTYERGGSNGHSRLMQMDISVMRAALAGSPMRQPEAPARWGDMRQHIFYGAAYHLPILIANRRYSGYRPHRDISVLAEARLNLRRLLLLPVHAIGRRLAERRIRHGGFPCHLVLLQLAHDSSFRMHGPFADIRAFIDTCMAGFALGAPRHHHIVFKAHPLEDGRSAVARDVAERARHYGVQDRVHFVRGGKLSVLLSIARTAVTVNSTAAQQALWRGLPVRAFGQAVYSKPELVSSQPLAEFYARPSLPDMQAYYAFRAYLLATSQVTGGFYSQRGRNRLLRQVADMVLAHDDPYDALTADSAGPRLQPE